MAGTEYDYSKDMEQGIRIMPIKMTPPLSLSCSRFNNTLSSHRRVLMDLEHYIQQSKNQEQERIKQLKSRQKNIGNELCRQQAHKQMKKKELEEEMRKKKFSQCTFKPKINASTGPTRNFQQFLQTQNAHLCKVQKKREQLKKNIDSQKQKATYKPKINDRRKPSKQSNLKNSKEPQESVFNRLYALKDKQLPIQEEDPNAFQPLINERSRNMVRQGPVQELLYKQALRRQSRQNNEVMMTSTGQSKVQKTLNFNNQKFAAQKFIKEYFFALEDLNIESSFQADIDYLMFSELLKKLGFVTNEQEEQTQASSAQRAMIHGAYQFLSDKKVNARNICVFLLAIIGIYHINPINFDEGEQIDQEKQLNLEQGDGRKLQRHFDLFFRNRLSSQATRKPIQKVQQYSFQPKINAQSEAMAEKHRNLMLQQANQLISEYPELQFSIPEDGVITHTDLLVLHKMAKQLEKQRMRQERDDQQMKECTFKPKTLANSMHSSKISLNQSTNKCFELYQYHKELKSKKDSMKASRQQVDPECTFKPVINRNQPLKHPQVQPSKQTDETLYRMHKGRQQYEQKKQFLERGEKFRKRSSVVKEEQKIPTLILDVNLGEKVDRIVIYQGDENRLQELAHQFGEKHELDEESTQKLFVMLQNQLQNVLCKIEEDQDSEDAEY